jgi:hypothetical protein
MFLQILDITSEAGRAAVCFAVLGWDTYGMDSTLIRLERFSFRVVQAALCFT